MYDPSTPLGSCFQFSSLSCFNHPWLNKTNAHAFSSSFGYRYYSTRCWLVRHQLLTTNRWNKILRIHSGYDLSSGAVCRFCDSFLDSGHKKSRASLHPFVTALSHISASGLPEPASEQYSYITLDIEDYHYPFLKISPWKGISCPAQMNMGWYGSNIFRCPAPHGKHDVLC